LEEMGEGRRKIPPNQTKSDKKDIKKDSAALILKNQGASKKGFVNKYVSREKAVMDRNEIQRF